MSTRTSIWLPVSLPPQRFLQAAGDLLRHQPRYVAAEGGDLLDSAGGEKTVLRGGHEVDGFDVGGQRTVELVHLQLVLEVADRAQALDDRLGPLLAREVDHELVERDGADVAQMRGGALDEADPLLRVEQRLAL